MSIKSREIKNLGIAIDHPMQQILKLLPASGFSEQISLIDKTYKSSLLERRNQAEADKEQRKFESIDEGRSHVCVPGVWIICVSTDYKSACEASLKKSTNGNSAPKEYVRAAISALVDEVNGAFASLDDIKSDDPDVKVAVEQCREMHGYASGELNRTLGTIDDANSLSHLPAQVHELKNWLSATSAYQQTCIDGFPAGELQDKMQARLESAKRMTSNALTIVGKVSSFAPVLHGSGSRLLQEEEEENHSANGIPAWVPESERRVLESRATKEFTPNVTVAKDGTGDFKTISDALSHLPAKYDGRQAIATCKILNLSNKKKF
ncbi:hypothetical protein ZIOFF_046068 [Zingiber officinale]|uniref:Pectinesterase inhibitor domain-containing protein n=1 Tax=Zingiber officinale TaxID=94328 RepID=A0A8J5KS95_ZINOF|nr:hypothetical protein ZIOFF_046068 [Zingiber officinale]